MAKKKNDVNTMHPLTRWRFENGQISLATLGKRVKASAPHLSDIENGAKSPSIELAQRITRVTHLSVRQIAPNLLRMHSRLARLTAPDEPARA